MNAVAEDGPRRQQSALLVNVGVIARVHIKMMHFLELLAILGQVGLKIGLEARSQLSGAPH